MSDIQDYFKYIFKKYGENTNKPLVQKYVNKIENRITFKIKNGHSLELLTLDTMKLLGSTENKLTEDNTFVPNKPYGSLLEISQTNLICLKTFNSEYSEIKVWLTDQNSKPLEIEDRTNLTMVVILGL